MSEAEADHLGTGIVADIEDSEPEYQTDDESPEAVGSGPSPATHKMSPLGKTHFACLLCAKPLSEGDTATIFCSGEQEAGHAALCLSCFSSPADKNPTRGPEESPCWALAQGVAKVRGWAKPSTQDWGEGLPAYMEHEKVPALQGFGDRGRPVAYVRLGSASKALPPALICVQCWDSGVRASGPAQSAAGEAASGRHGAGSFQALLADIDHRPLDASVEPGPVVTPPRPFGFESESKSISSALKLAATEELVILKLEGLGIQLSSLPGDSELVRGATQLLGWDHVRRSFEAEVDLDSWSRFESAMERELARVQVHHEQPRPVKTSAGWKVALKKFFDKASIILEEPSADSVHQVNQLAGKLTPQLQGMLVFSGFDYSEQRFTASSPEDLSSVVAKSVAMLAGSSGEAQGGGRDLTPVLSSQHVPGMVASRQQYVPDANFGNRRQGYVAAGRLAALGSEEAPGAASAAPNARQTQSASLGTRPSWESAVTGRVQHRQLDDNVALGLASMGLPPDFVDGADLKLRARMESQAKAAEIRHPVGVDSYFSRPTVPRPSNSQLESPSPADDPDQLFQLIKKYLPDSDHQRNSGDFVDVSSCLTLCPTAKSLKDEIMLGVKSKNKAHFVFFEEDDAGVRMQNVQKPSLAAGTVFLANFTQAQLNKYFELAKDYLLSNAPHLLALWKLVKHWVLNKQSAAQLGTRLAPTEQDKEMELHLSLGKIHLIRRGAQLTPPHSLERIKSEFNTDSDAYINNCRAYNRFDAARQVFAQRGFNRTSPSASIVGVAFGITGVGNGNTSPYEAASVSELFSASETQMSQSLRAAWFGINSTTKCKNCQELGHSAVACTKTRDSSLPCQICYNATGVGHSEFDCPGFKVDAQSQPAYAAHLRIQKLLFGTRVNFFPSPRSSTPSGGGGVQQKR